MRTGVEYKKLGMPGRLFCSKQEKDESKQSWEKPNEIRFWSPSSGHFQEEQNRKNHPRHALKFKSFYLKSCFFSFLAAQDNNPAAVFIFHFSFSFFFFNLGLVSCRGWANQLRRRNSPAVEIATIANDPSPNQRLWSVRCKLRKLKRLTGLA